MHSDSCWTLVNIYGPCGGVDRHTFTSRLFDLNIPASEDWILAGELNYITTPDNRNGPGGNTNNMLTFNDFIRTHSFVELPIKVDRLCGLICSRSPFWNN